MFMDQRSRSEFHFLSQGEFVMRRNSWIAVGVITVVAALPLWRARADEIPEKYRATVHKALKYLVKQQFKDGHWGAQGDNYPVSMTGLAGVALLMEGSTVREGEY